MQNNKREIDIIAERNYSFWQKSYQFIAKSEIKTWHGIFVLALVVGAATAYMWSFTQGLQPSSDAATLSFNRNLGSRIYCLDTDKGMNYFQKGISYGYGPYGYGYSKGNKNYKYTDQCEGVNYLREYYCIKGKTSTNIKYYCQAGCKNGACNKPIPVCKDSDGGQNYKVKGTLLYSYNGKNYQYNDACLNARILKEFMCSKDGKNRVQFTNYSCPRGCKNSICL
jgi:hypothetical protein